MGYARGSTSRQLLNHQIHMLNNAGCIRISADKQSGKITDTPELDACRDFLRAETPSTCCAAEMEMRAVKHLDPAPARQP